MKVSEKKLRQIIQEVAARFAPTAQAEAEKINAQIGGDAFGMLVTDQDFWEKQGVRTGEQLALTLISQTYSDMHKELYGRRPRIPAFATVDEAQAATDDLWAVYEERARQEELDVQAQKELEDKQRELQALMPGEFDYEHAPMRSGMGRRMEGAVDVSKERLQQLIKEELRHVFASIGGTKK